MTPFWFARFVGCNAPVHEVFQVMNGSEKTDENYSLVMDHGVDSKKRGRQRLTTTFGPKSETVH